MKCGYSAKSWKGVTIKPIKGGFRKPAAVIDRFPTEPEVLAIIEKTSRDCKVAFQIMAYSGLRKGDCVSLKWSAIDFKSRFIRYRQQKTGKLVRIPLNENLLDAFNAVPRGVGDVPVVRCTAKALGCQWSKARKKVNLEWVRIHDLRHFYGSYLASNGIRREVIAEILGHKDLKSTARYAKFDDQALLDAGEVFVRKPSAKREQW